MCSNTEKPENQSPVSEKSVTSTIRNPTAPSPKSSCGGICPPTSTRSPRKILPSASVQSSQAPDAVLCRTRWPEYERVHEESTSNRTEFPSVLVHEIEPARKCPPEPGCPAAGATAARQPAAISRDNRAPNPTGLQALAAIPPTACRSATISAPELPSRPCPRQLCPLGSGPSPSPGSHRPKDEAAQLSVFFC